jgi:hypothetical protein
MTGEPPHRWTAEATALGGLLFAPDQDLSAAVRSVRLGFNPQGSLRRPYLGPSDAGTQQVGDPSGLIPDSSAPSGGSDSAAALFARGQISEGKFDYEAAAAHYGAALSLSPDDFAIASRLGHLYMLMGDMDRVRDHLVFAHHLRPKSAAPLLALASLPEGLVAPADLLEWIDRRRLGPAMQIGRQRQD